MVPPKSSRSKKSSKNDQDMGHRGKRPPKSSSSKKSSNAGQDKTPQGGRGSKSLFGSEAPRDGDGSKSLFGSKVIQDGGGPKSLFGSKVIQDGGGPKSLFGSEAPRDNGGSKSLFGSKVTQGGRGSTSLFGSKVNVGGGVLKSLFGGEAPRDNGGSKSLFGSKVTQGGRGSTSLFGSEAPRDNRASMSLFGSKVNVGGGVPKSLFGGEAPRDDGGSKSLFGSKVTQDGGGIFKRKPRSPSPRSLKRKGKQRQDEVSVEIGGPSRPKYGDEGNIAWNGESSSIVKLLRTRYKRWDFGHDPITQFRDAPNDWNSEDNDINEHDIDAVIQRCKDRIEDGIMPQWWKEKLKRYRKYRKMENEVEATENLSLSRDTLVRLKVLEAAVEHIKKKGDTFQQMVNLKPIMAAYRSGKLEARSSYVSYWSNGKRMTDMIKFQWDDVDKYHKACGGVSFCVEGCTVREDMYAYHNPPYRGTIPAHYVEYPNLVNIELVLKGPGAPDSASICRTFLDDTGATFARIYLDDLQNIVQKSGKPCPFLCYMDMAGVFGTTVVPTCKVDCNILSPTDLSLLRPWFPLQVTITEQIWQLGSLQRLAPGSLLRSVLYTGTAPDNSAGPLYISETHGGITSLLPSVDVCNAKARPLESYAVGDPSTLGSFFAPPRPLLYFHPDGLRAVAW